MISQGKNAVIVEHLDTGKRMPAYASSRISGLEDISIYTKEDELPLAEVLKKIMDKEGNKEIDHPKKMSNDELKSYFIEIVPEYDTDRVYISDMKKVLVWYNELLKHGLLEKEPEPESVQEPDPEPVSEPSKTDEIENTLPKETGKEE